MMKRFLLMMLLVFSIHLPAQAENQLLVPCSQSQAFQERQQNAPNTYYYEKPFQVYSSELLCGQEDGLPHLPIQWDRAIDVAIPIGLFLYIAGFIGWTGRAYLIAANQHQNPEEQEIFINIPLLIRAKFQGLLWPLFALKELLSGELTAKNSEISVSPR